MSYDRYQRSDRAGVVGRGSGSASAADHVSTPGKKTLTQNLPAADPRLAPAANVVQQLGAIADATHQLESTVIPQWYAALDRMDPGTVGVIGSAAMMQWSRIELSVAQLGDQRAAAEPMLRLARGQLGQLGVRQVAGVPVAPRQPVTDADAMAFIHARIEQAQSCIKRAVYVRGLHEASPRDDRGQHQLDDTARAQVAMVLEGYPDPIEVRWLEMQCARFGLSLRMQGDHDGRTHDRLTHAQDHLDLSRKAQGDVDTAFSERISNDVDRLIGLTGRATHWVADKLRDASDGLYDATGASKEGRGLAIGLADGSGALAATAATMGYSATAKGAQAVKTIADASDSASTIARVLEEVQVLNAALQGASEAWKLLAEIGIRASEIVLDVGGGMAIGDAHRRERAATALGELIDVYLKRREPKEGDEDKRLGHPIQVAILAAVGAALTEIKNALLDSVKKNEAVELREVAKRAIAGWVGGGVFTALKNQINESLREFIVHQATKLLEHKHPALVAMLETVGKEPIKRLIEFIEERLQVKEKLQHGVELVIGGLAGEHEKPAGEHEGGAKLRGVRTLRATS